jgi:uncharacterized protein YndB with AHSA1/START domain
MPSTYRIDAAQHIVWSRAWGVLAEDESAEHYRLLAADPAFRPSFRQMCDLRTVDRIEMSTPSIRALAKAAVFDPGVRRAFLAPADAHYGLARMLQAFCEIEGTEIGVFRTAAEAADWLDLSPDAIGAPELGVKDATTRSAASSPAEGSVHVRVRRAFTAAPEPVFDAWLDVGLLGRWMFGPGVRDEALVRLATDPRVGGSFSFVVRRQGEEIDHVGAYLEIDRPTRLVFTWNIGTADPTSIVTIDFVRGTGCQATLVHAMDPKWAEFTGRAEAGWTAMLGALAAMIDR